MQVFDEVAKCLQDIRSCRQVVVDHTNDCLVYGYVSRYAPVDNCLYYLKDEGLVQKTTYMPLMRDKLFFSNSKGLYISKVGIPEEAYLAETYTMGQGRFPYNFERRYEAIENFSLFKGSQMILNPGKKYILAEFLKYTFGLEFETSQGYVPEELCFRDGLIPLRDGSITGVEYSTVVLEGNKGISLLEQQLESLKKYTCFNKECSLHIHFGGFPLDAEKLFTLNKVCRALENSILQVTPDYTFSTSKYKASGKDYCNRLNNYSDFNEMYEYLVGRKFYNDFTQPHPHDIKREAKWRIHTRYFWVNFLNALCYNVNKTIEFRFLRPTYNFNKIKLWLYILNAIMLYAEKTPSNEVPSSQRLNLSYILREVYPRDLYERLNLGLTRLRIEKVNQKANGDNIGQDLSSEYMLFNGELGF